MQSIEPYCLSIAGFDPSAGAGVLADIKTFEANGVYGFGVCSALTFQNDKEFDDLKWISPEQIIAQIAPLQRRFDIKCVKIGLIENLNTLSILISALETQHPKLIWDPILKASAGFTFHNAIDKAQLIKVLKSIYLITPNIPEAIQLTGIQDASVAAQWLAQYCNVLLKGGHSTSTTATDTLYSNGKTTRFETPLYPNKAKHGSGCVLSSAITANLAKGLSLAESCKKAKEYVNKFIQSSDILLGKHFQYHH